MVHSFILDPDDAFIREAFDEEEMSEMVKKGNIQDPEINENILNYINTFAKVGLHYHIVLVAILLILNVSSPYRGLWKKYVNY